LSWKVEVIVDGSGEWRSSALRFATRKEAQAYAENRYAEDDGIRWTVRDIHVVRTKDEVNAYVDANRRVGRIAGMSRE
jgi:hypothetical protein